MSSATLEERVSTLEGLVARLLSQTGTKRQRKDWRKAIGRFPNDEGLKEIDTEGAAIRAADRRRSKPVRKSSRSLKRGGRTGK